MARAGAADRRGRFLVAAAAAQRVGHVQLQGDTGERVAEHVVDLAGDPAALLQRGLPRLGCQGTLSGVGGAPIWPAVTCWLCCWIEETTSCGIRLRTCSLFGSSQTRIEYWPAPNTVTLPTPGSRDSSSRILMVA